MLPTARPRLKLARLAPAGPTQGGWLDDRLSRHAIFVRMLVVRGRAHEHHHGDGHDRLHNPYTAPGPRITQDDRAPGPHPPANTRFHPRGMSCNSSRDVRSLPFEVAYLRTHPYRCTTLLWGNPYYGALAFSSPIDTLSTSRSGFVTFNTFPSAKVCPEFDPVATGFGYGLGAMQAN
jgi:hypothetical protein